MSGALYLLPFVAYVWVKRSGLDRDWKWIAEMALAGYVAICLVALIVGAGA